MIAFVRPVLTPKELRLVHFSFSEKNTDNAGFSKELLITKTNFAFKLELNNEQLVYWKIRCKGLKLCGLVLMMNPGNLFYVL